MRRLLVGILMVSLLSACGMCSKKEEPVTDEVATPTPVATTSPAASNACDEVKCGPTPTAPSKGAAHTVAPTATQPAPAPGPEPAPASSGASKGASAPTPQTPTPKPTTTPPTASSAPGATAGAAEQLRLSRDPFRKYVGGGVGLGRYPELTNLPLTSFRYVGIVKNDDENLALLEDHAGNGHTVRIGTRIGKEGGQISEITEQQIVVKTMSKDSSGRSSTKYFRLPFYVRM